MFAFETKPFECESTVDRISRLQSARRLHTTSTGSHLCKVKAEDRVPDPNTNKDTK